MSHDPEPIIEPSGPVLDPDPDGPPAPPLDPETPEPELAPI
jgi:hypothetical protein